MFSEEMCGFCLGSSNTRLKNVHSKRNGTNLTYFEKVTSYLTDLKNVIDAVEDFVICEKCCEKIDDIYEYNQTCLKNAKIFSSYQDTLKEIKKERDKTRFQQNVNEGKIKEKTNESHDEYSNCQMTYLTVKNFDTSNQTSNFDSKNAKETDRFQNAPKLPANQFENNKILHINRLNEFVNVKQEPVSDLTAVNHNSFHDVQENVIKKEIDEVQPSFGDHYLSSFAGEPPIQQIHEELDIKMDSTNSSDPLLENEEQIDDSNDEDDLDGDMSNQSTTLTRKSTLKYQNTYRNYLDWAESRQISDITTEETMLTYFEDIAKRYKASSLFTIYSMLKTTFAKTLQKDISRYRNLLDYIKGEAKNYVPRKSEIFTIEQVAIFLIKASDEKFLLAKVILIIGLAGSFRNKELYDLPFENIKDLGNSFCLKISDSKSNRLRKVLILPGDIPGVNFVEIIRKYIKLRPKVTDHDRLFTQYRNSHCYKQAVGINALSCIPKKVAKYLNLPNSNQFTGHCFRRSSKQWCYAPKKVCDQNIVNFGVFTPGPKSHSTDLLENNKDPIAPFPYLDQNGEASSSHQVWLTNPSNFWGTPS